MSARAAEPTGADADTVRITPPDGKIHLGRRMVLQERAAPTSTSWSAFATGLPDDGTIAPIDSPFPPAVPGELAMQSLQQSLEADRGGSSTSRATAWRSPTASLGRRSARPS